MVTTEESAEDERANSAWTVVGSDGVLLRNLGNATSQWGKSQMTELPRGEARTYPAERSGPMRSQSRNSPGRALATFKVNELQFSREDQDLAERCQHCGIVGHRKETCRRLLGLCLVCGARDHRVKDCSRRRQPRSGPLHRSRSEGPSRMAGRLEQRVRFNMERPQRNRSLPTEGQHGPLN